MDYYDIDNAIRRMECNGYSYEPGVFGSIGFWTPFDENEDRKYKIFSTWEDVNNFVKENNYV